MFKSIDLPAIEAYHHLFIDTLQEISVSTPARDQNDLLIPDIFWHVTQRSSSRIAWRAKTAAVGGHEYTETRIEKLTLIDVRRCLRWLATKISTLPNTFWWMLPLVEVQNGTSKNVGVEKIFVLSRYRSVFYGSRRLEVSLSADLCVSKSPIFCRLVSESRICCFHLSVWSSEVEFFQS